MPTSYLLDALRSSVATEPAEPCDSTAVRRRAAVLCPIVERRDGPQVILTRRSPHLKAHAGQISFPGGKIDRNDPSPLHAALREAQEEIGLHPSLVDVIGVLDRYDTRTGFLVQPFVGLVDPRFRATASPDEVDEVFEVPFDFVMDLRNQTPVRMMRGGVAYEYFEIIFRHHRIWGATAAMLHDLALRLAEAGFAAGRPTRATTATS